MSLKYTRVDSFINSHVIPLAIFKQLINNTTIKNYVTITNLSKPLLHINSIETYGLWQFSIKSNIFYRFKFIHECDSIQSELLSDDFEQAYVRRAISVDRMSAKLSHDDIQKRLYDIFTDLLSNVINKMLLTKLLYYQDMTIKLADNAFDQLTSNPLIDVDGYDLDSDESALHYDITQKRLMVGIPTESAVVSHSETYVNLLLLENYLNGDKFNFLSMSDLELIFPRVALNDLSMNDVYLDDVLQYTLVKYGQSISNAEWLETTYPRVNYFVGYDPGDDINRMNFSNYITIHWWLKYVPPSVADLSNLGVHFLLHTSLGGKIYHGFKCIHRATYDSFILRGYYQTLRACRTIFSAERVERNRYNEMLIPINAISTRDLILESMCLTGLPNSGEIPTNISQFINFLKHSKTSYLSGTYWVNDSKPIVHNIIFVIEGLDNGPLLPGMTRFELIRKVARSIDYLSSSSGYTVKHIGFTNSRVNKLIPNVNFFKFYSALTFKQPRFTFNDFQILDACSVNAYHPNSTTDLSHINSPLLTDLGPEIQLAFQMTQDYVLKRTSLSTSFSSDRHPDVVTSLVGIFNKDRSVIESRPDNKELCKLFFLGLDPHLKEDVRSDGPGYNEFWLLVKQWMNLDVPTTEYFEIVSDVFGWLFNYVHTLVSNVNLKRWEFNLITLTGIPITIICTRRHTLSTYFRQIGFDVVHNVYIEDFASDTLATDLLSVLVKSHGALISLVDPASLLSENYNVNDYYRIINMVMNMYDFSLTTIHQYQDAIIGTRIKDESFRTRVRYHWRLYTSDYLLPKYRFIRTFYSNEYSNSALDDQGIQTYYEAMDSSMRYWVGYITFDRYNNVTPHIMPHKLDDYISGTLINVPARAWRVVCDNMSISDVLFRLSFITSNVSIRYRDPERSTLYVEFATNVRTAMANLIEVNPGHAVGFGCLIRAPLSSLVYNQHVNSNFKDMRIISAEGLLQLYSYLTINYLLEHEFQLVQPNQNGVLIVLDVGGRDGTFCGLFPLSARYYVVDPSVTTLHPRAKKLHTIDGVDSIVFTDDNDSNIMDFVAQACRLERTTVTEAIIIVITSFFWQAIGETDDITEINMTKRFVTFHNKLYVRGIKYVTNYYNCLEIGFLPDPSFGSGTRHPPTFIHDGTYFLGSAYLKQFRMIGLYNRPGDGIIIHRNFFFRQPSYYDLILVLYIFGVTTDPINWKMIILLSSIFRVGFCK